MSCLLGMEAVQLLMRGTPLKRIALAAMAVLALVTIALLYVRGQPDVLENAPSTGKQVATVDASEASDRVTSAGHDATPATTWASASSAEIDRDFHDTRNRAESGDPVAQRKLAQIYERCMLCSQSPENFRGTLASFAKADVENSKHYVAAGARLSHYCDSIDSGKRIPMVAYQLWYAEAARRGDLIAQIKVATTIENQPTEAAYRELVAKAFQSRDPEAIFALGDMLSLAKASVDLGLMHRSLVATTPSMRGSWLPAVPEPSAASGLFAWIVHAWLACVMAQVSKARSSTTSFLRPS
nr:hypothetical protein VDP59_005640 [Xanthomonas campestris pv. campestris]